MCIKVEILLHKLKDVKKKLVTARGHVPPVLWRDKVLH